MIYLMLSISVCTLVMVVFISIDVLRNRSVVDKTREDIEMIKKSVRDRAYNQKESSSRVTARISRTYHPSRTLRWGMIL